MDLSLTDDQEALREAVSRFLAKASSPERVRAAEPGGFDEAVWRGLVEMGIPTMGVPEADGGGGASLADLAVVAEQAGAALAPVPIIEAMVSGRLLAAFGVPVENAKLATVAVRPAIRGRAALVPGGAVAELVVLLDGDALVVVRPKPSTTTDRTVLRNLGSAPLADVAVEVDGGDRTEVACGIEAVEAYQRALDEWRALTATWLIGLARSALGIGVQYVKDRKQFGVPIGSFQAVQHHLADLATALDGAALLAAKAAWSLDAGDPDAATFAAMAFSFCGETAQAAAAAALHYHGGYGFMEEYDIQLYFRRAKASRLVLDDPRRELQHVADRLFGPTEQAGEVTH
jgi:alkylation response protein AidB-like acyl-CoA dehydrogenase